MKIRGERECTACGTRWSYYETGSVGCPACGSLQSVGTGERAEHTDTQVQLDLTGVRADVDAVDLETLAERAGEQCRDYLRQRGFLAGGRLRDLDETYLAAAELREVSDVLARATRIDDREELYFLTLLRGADEGDRPAPDAIPASLWAGRGLATATAVKTYRRDLRTWTADRARNERERALLEELLDHVTRIQMLDGAVAPVTADTLVAATRALADGLRGVDGALESAQDHLDRMTYDAA